MCKKAIKRRCTSKNTIKKWQSQNRTHTHTHTFTGPFVQNGNFTEARDSSSVAVASAGPYASLHLTPVTQPYQHHTMLLLQAWCQASSYPHNIMRALMAQITKLKRQVALLSQRDRATCLSVEILQLQNIAIVWHYLRDPTFSRFYTIPKCDRHTHTDGRTDTRRRHVQHCVAR